MKKHWNCTLKRLENYYLFYQVVSIETHKAFFFVPVLEILGTTYQGSPTFSKVRANSWVPINAKASSSIHTSEKKILLNLSLIMLLKSITFIYPKALMMLMLFSAQVRGHHVGGPWPRRIVLEICDA